MVNENSLLIIEKGKTVVNRTNLSTRNETPQAENKDLRYTGKVNGEYTYASNKDNTPSDKTSIKTEEPKVEPIPQVRSALELRQITSVQDLLDKGGTQGAVNQANKKVDKDVTIVSVSPKYEPPPTPVVETRNIKEVYYTSNKSFKPSGDAIAVYVDENGRLTGETSDSAIDLSSGKGVNADREKLSQTIKETPIITTYTSYGEARPQTITVEQTARPNYQLKDIDLKASFTGKPTTNKPNIANFIDTRITNALNDITSPIGEAIPFKNPKTNPIKQYVFGENRQFSPTELIKFGFFSPAFITPAETLPKPNQPIVREIKSGENVYQTVQDTEGNIFKISTPQPKETFFTEDVIRPTIRNGQLLTSERFQMASLPKYAVQYNPSPIGRLLFSPTQIQTAPFGQYFFSSSEILVDESGNIVNQPNVVLREKGKDQLTFFNLEGRQINIEQSKLSTLPKDVQKQFISAYPYTKEGSTYSFGEVRTTKLGDITTEGKVIPEPYGQRTSLGSVVSESNPMYTKEGEFTVYDTSSNIKDISLPTYKGDKLPSEVFLSGKSTVFTFNTGEDTSSGVNFIKLSKPININAKPVVTLKQSEGAFANLANKPIIPSEPIKPIVSTEEAITPTTIKVINTPISSQKQESMELVTPSNILSQGTTLKNIIKDIPAQQEKVITLQDTSSRLRSGIKHGQTNIQIPTDIQIPAQTIIPKIIPKQIEVTPVKNILGEESIRPTINSKLMPLIQVPKAKKSSSSVLSRLRAAYNVAVFRSGRPEIIAKRLPFAKAEKVGVQNVISNLRASFKLIPAGTTSEEDIFYKLPSTFRPSKVEKNRFVQKLNTRFGARGETSEAQFFRKAKARKIKWF